MNITGTIDLEINSGGAAAIYVAGFFLICLASKWILPVGQALVGVLTAWTGGLAAILIKRHANNRLRAADSGSCLDLK